MSADTGAQIADKLDNHFGSSVWQQGSRNTLPVFSNESHTAIQGENLVITLEATDADQDSITYSVTGGTDFSLASNVLTFNSAVIGEQVLTVDATDEKGGVGSGTLTINVIVPPPNVPPTVDDQNIDILVNVPKTITLGPVNDSEGDSLTYTVVGSSDFTQNNNRITFTSSTLGTQVLTVTADDGKENGAVQATVTVNIVNETTETVPTILEVAEQFPAIDSLFTYSPIISNPTTAGDVRWYKDFGHDDVVVNQTTGAISWDTTGLAGETHYIGLRCSNGNGSGRVVFLVHLGKVQGDIHYVGPYEAVTDWETIEPLTLAGDTIVFRDGTYTGLKNRIGRNNDAGVDRYPKSGNAVKHTCVVAENPTMAVFDGGDAGVGFNLWSGGKNESSYITFKGLFFQGGSTLAINGDPNDKANTRPHHIKIVCCGGAGEDDIPLYARLTDYMLFENCFAYGGGRYKISINESTKCVYRRNLARYDRSDRKTAEDPKGSHIMYNVMDFRMDNCVAIDDVDQFVNSGYKVGAFGTPVTGTSVTPEGARGHVERCLQLNSEQLLSQFDYQVSNGGGASDVESRDVSSYDCRPHDIFLYTWGFNLWEKCTFSKVRPLQPANTDYLINGGGYNNFRGLVNCIVDDVDPVDTGVLGGVTNITVGQSDVPYNGGVSRTVTKYGMLNNNLTDVGALALIREGYGEQHETGTTTTSITGDNQYVTRLKSTNPLATTHAAEVMYLKGKSGTYWGDVGYDVDTEIPMWDFPFQYYIREKMATYSWTGPEYTGSDYLNRVAGTSQTLAGDRGFCATGENLSSYVWGYKGATVPPMGLQGFNGDAQGTIKWESPASGHSSNITSYNVYEYTPADGSYANPTSIPAGTTTATITGLINGFDNWFVVTAVDSVKGESGFSYPVYIRPNGVATVLPQIDAHPQSETVVEGDQVIFTASVQGYDSLQWTRNGSNISGATGLSYVMTAAAADDGAVYALVATNTVGSQSSNGATLSVYPLDSTAPTISVSLSNDILTLTVSDNVYANGDLQLQLLDSGTPIGSTFAGSLPSIDLTTYPIPGGVRVISVRATDPQANTADSNTVNYTVGTPIFTDDFSDASNWQGSLAVAGNEGTLNGTITGNTAWWNNQTKFTAKFDYKVMDQANDFEVYPRMEFGCGTDGSDNGTIKMFAYPRQVNNGWFDYVDRSGTNHGLGSFSGFGNTSGDTGGNEPWRECEFIAAGTSFEFKIDGVTVHTATLPEDINPVNGTVRIEPNAAGDGKIRNLVLYGD